MAVSRLNNNKKGQSLVETALLLPIMLLAVLGLIQFAMIFSGQIVIASAAKEGARLAVVGKSDAAVKDKVMAVSSLMPFIRIDPAGIEIEPAPAARYEDGDVTVEFTAAVGAVPFFDRVLNKDLFILSAKAEMRCESYPVPD
ncbi:MAG: TadE/TadG family type IV pilus assembly protein [Dethiobacteria bacterium]|jgi:hypothetical protein